MKNILVSFICFIFCCVCSAQQAPPTQNLPDCNSSALQPLQSLPGLQNITNYNSRNFRRVFIPQYAVNSDQNINISNLSRDVLITTMYYDGLGRPMQNVLRYGAGYLNDWIQPFVYDNVFGSEEYKYLPYSVVETSSTGRGKFRANALTELKTLYDNKYPGEHPYFKNVYDKSVMNDVVKTMAAGNSWVGNNKGLTETKRTNLLSQNDQIIFFYIATNDINDLPEKTAFYSDGILFVTEEEDENGKTVIKYKDQSGRLIAERVPEMENLSGVPQSDIYKKLFITYYVYDDFGKLRIVITPEAYKQVFDQPQYTSFLTTVADGLCYKYWYDERGRLSEKKDPGKEVEYYVYDNRGRLVLSQDGMLRNQGRWAYTVYDKYNRPLFEGEELSGRTKQNWIDCFKNNLYTQFQNNVIAYYLLKEEIYNEYPPTVFWDADVLIKNYYDEPLQGFSFDYSNISSLTGQSPYAITPQPTTRNTGRLTGKEVLVKEPNNNWYYKKTAYFYDDFDNLIQVHKEHIGGTDIITNQYDHVGDIVSTYYNHSFQGNPQNILTSYVKDVATGEILYVNQQINGGVTTTIYRNTYDEFKRLKSKQLGGLTTNNYEYNIRGFMTAINPNHLNSTTQSGSGPFFGELLSYDKGFTSKMYNGSISGIKWRGYGVNSPTRFYGYTYDPIDRLTHAEFGEEIGSCTWSKVLTDYTVSNISYDWNGNIKTVNRKGVDNGNVVDMDLMTYTYDNHSNQLIQVEDNGLHTTTLPDFKNNSSAPIEYTYDANGNLLTDLNKGITNPIAYNMLNLPTSITLDGKGVIEYVYNGEGDKLSKIITDNNQATQTRIDYVGPFIYKNNTLQYINHEEGRVRVEYIALQDPNGGWVLSTNYKYDYFIKDHLSNVRNVIHQEPVLMTEYMADHEIALANTENLVFTNIDNVRDQNPLSIDPDDQMAAELDANDPNRTVGTAIMLRVMAGDKFAVNVNTYYEDSTTGQDSIINEELLFNTLMNTLLAGNTYEGMPVNELPENTALIQNAFGNPDNVSLYNQMVLNNYDPSAPTAYLSYLVFDEEMNLVTDNSGIKQWGSAPGQWNQVGTTNEIEVMQNGYLVCYISNQSLLSTVWGDKLRLQFYRGKLLEENHYYPFGLTLSSNSLKPNEKNNIKYNSKELQDDEFLLPNGTSAGLGWYDFGARMHDPQLARWQNVDPLAQKYYKISPYAYTANNPVKYVDPNGKELKLGGREFMSQLLDLINSILGAKDVFVASTSQSNQLDGGAPLDVFTINVRNTQYKSSDPIKQSFYDLIKGMVISTDLWYLNVDKSGNLGHPVFFDNYDTRTIYLDNINALKGMQYHNSAYALYHFFLEQQKAGPGVLNQTPKAGYDETHAATLDAQSTVFKYKHSLAAVHLADDQSFDVMDVDILDQNNGYITTLRVEQNKDNNSYEMKFFQRKNAKTGVSLIPGEIISPIGIADMDNAYLNDYWGNNYNY